MPIAGGGRSCSVWERVSQGAAGLILHRWSSVPNSELLGYCRDHRYLPVGETTNLFSLSHACCLLLTLQTLKPKPLTQGAILQPFQFRYTV